MVGGLGGFLGLRSCGGALPVGGISLALEFLLKLAEFGSQLGGAGGVGQGICIVFCLLVAEEAAVGPDGDARDESQVTASPGRASTSCGPFGASAKAVAQCRVTSSAKGSFAPSNAARTSSASVVLESSGGATSYSVRRPRIG